jgi:hypothetical protein
MANKAKSQQKAFEDHVLSRLLAMPPDPHKPPKAKKKPAKKPRRR